MSLYARRELATAVALRYRSSSKRDKSRILDELVASTGFHRKYAIQCLNGVASSPPAVRTQSVRRSRRRKYGADVENAFLELWKASGCICPKLLIPFAPVYIEAHERHGELIICPQVKDKLLCVSISTAERMVVRRRRSLEHGISTTKPGTLLRHQIPIRKYNEWCEAQPGFFEIDLVAHCGGTAAGDYIYTLTMTDICSGWTEYVALLNRSKIAVTEGIEKIRRRLPFPLLGIDSDNGSEFINYHLKDYCDDHKITFTRCQPYKKNDQCYVEQKNGAVIRPLVGYARYEGVAAADHINRLYRVHRLSLNFFKPTMKLTGKSRDGARVTKTYDTPQTPYQRLLIALPLTKEERERRWNKEFLPLNPAKLRRTIEDLQMGLRCYTVEDLMRNVTVEGGTEYGTAA